VVEDPASEVSVVHVIARYPPSLGGAETVAHALATMRPQASRTLVLTSRDTQEALDHEASSFVRRFRSVEIANTKIMPGLAGTILRLPRDTVIHLHITSAFVPEMVYLAHLLRGTRYVAHIHFDVLTSGCWAGFALRNIWMPVILRRVLRAAGAVIVFTESQRQAIASEYGVEPARIVLIPNGVENGFFHDEARVLRARPRLLFVGRLAAEKNLSVLLEALAGISQRFETTIVGEGPLKAELIRQAADLGLDNVRFYGRAVGDELHHLYRAADVFVLPSKSEGMSLVLLEALAMGLPVVATDLSGNAEVVIHGENGLLVAPDSPATLRTALLEIIRDVDTYQQMSRTARKLAEQYRWDAVRGDFEQVYARVRGRDRE
jgi:glycosyltransferase involved in cell wall biosynthesis